MEFLKSILGRHEKRVPEKPKPEVLTDYREWDIVKCGVCRRRLKVKYHDPGKVAIATADALKGVALRCQSCGFIVCDPCSMPPGGLGMPTCPRCRATMNGPSSQILKQ